MPLRRGRTRKVRRTQIPLHPSKCLTSYGAQGLTLECIMLDICQPPNPKSHAQSVYVGLSRVASLDDIAFLRPFTFEDLTAKTPADLDREIARLDRLAFETQVALATADGTAVTVRPRGERRPAETINLDNRPTKRLRTEHHKAASTVAAPRKAPLDAAAFDLVFDDSQHAAAGLASAEDSVLPMRDD